MHYKHLAFHALRQYIDSFEDLKVLEIGGGAKGESAIPFAQHGADVLVTNISHGIEKAKTIEHDQHSRTFRHPIQFAKADALDLQDFYGKYDIVFGVAVLEHIPRPDIYLDECRKCLRNRGILCIGGGPIWTCSYGHHLWVPGYTFKANNPLKPWEHLYQTTYDKLYERLEQRIASSTDAKLIADWVLNSKNINRIRASKLMETLESSKLKLRQLTCYNNAGKPTQEERTLLAEYSYQELTITGITALLHLH